VLTRTVAMPGPHVKHSRTPVTCARLEACTGAHEWARRFQALGHAVRLMAPAFVSPYRKSGKNDGNDAEAICEAVSRTDVNTGTHR
jgi:transposase